MAFWSLSTPGDGVAVAAYSNPAMNYFVPEAVEELAQHIGAWRADPSVRAVVLCGDGRSSGFITHFSVETLEQIASDPESAQGSAAVSQGYHAVLDELNRLPQAVVVAMNGDTMGGGFELSLACDIRIGQNGDHRYGLPEARARILDPAEALRLGLVHELADDAVARAVQIATEIAGLPATSIANIKAAIYQGIDAPLAAGLAVESGNFQNTMLSDAARDRMRTYLDQPESERRGWLEPGTAGWT